MTYKSAFPYYTDEMPVFEGFEDTSWRHDVCPSFQLSLGYFVLRVWVDHADPKKRECPEHSRYALDLSIDTVSSAFLLETDDLDLVRFVIDLVRKGGDFLCCWNGDLFEVHSKESLRRDYGDTNLFESDLPWAGGETDFETVLENLETGKTYSNQNDNMTIFRIAEPIKEAA